MVRVLYVVTLLASGLAAAILLFGFLGASSAPQEAAAAALAIGVAVIPYVFTRCVQVSNDYYARRDFEQKSLVLLQQANELAKRAGP